MDLLVTDGFGAPEGNYAIDGFGFVAQITTSDIGSGGPSAMILRKRLLREEELIALVLLLDDDYY